MVFSAPIFLFGFLPLVLLCYFASPRAGRNLVLLIASLVFYSWGEVFYVAIMFLSIAMNYLTGLGLARAMGLSEWVQAKFWLAAGVCGNLLLLGSYKYANFLADNLNLGLEAAGFTPVDLDPVHLPLGISFFSFQAMSYLVDVYRGQTQVQRNLLNLALYIALFPQLIAGPIVRFHDIADQITRRLHSLDLFASGVQRFIYGLSKKVLIANPLAEVADGIFGLPAEQLSTPWVWLGILCYTLQIYFDFSGYSDMAIGLGRMFGFRFLENFNYPYIALSIQEFWRRWHISLSTWFRDYLYIPLGGNRASTARVYTNLLIVFLLCGIWHGASWNFVVWGLWHGAFLVAERTGFGDIVQGLWRPLRSVYVLLVVMIGWVFFRADTLGYAMDYLAVMFAYTGPIAGDYSLELLVSNEVLLALAAGLVLSTPAFSSLQLKLQRTWGDDTARFQLQRVLLLGTLLAVAVTKVASSTYNPFIYFRF